MFRVVDSQGNEYGPADVETIKKWVAEGRITAETILVDEVTGSRNPARVALEGYGVFPEGGVAVAPPPPTAPPAPAAPQAGYAPPPPGAAANPGHQANPNYQNAPQYQPVSTGLNAQQNLLLSRFLALLIDGLITLPIAWMAMIPVINFIGAPVVCAYWLCRDGIFGNQSVGKKVIGLQVICEDGTPFTIAKSAMRNIIYAAYLVLIIPIFGWFLFGPLMGILGIVEIIMVVTSGKRIGDRLANTQVVASATGTALR